MKFIVGLGNPGAEYAKSRHNIGFDVIDRLMEVCDATLNRHKFCAQFGKTVIGRQEIVLVKPLTYMNASGEAVAPLLRFYHGEAAELLVVQDDMDLPVGKIRVRAKGSSGGHNGMKSLIQHLHTEEFSRIKVGIGHPERTQRAVISHVLNGFSAEEQPLIAAAILRAAAAAAAWVDRPLVDIMNQYNANQ
ncbi:MAG: aminoacyl-tRNA hydrolase [Sporolactobacillus sp.]